MPIYEFYCANNHRIYQFFARKLAHGSVVPPCPDNPKFKMERILSPFAVVGTAQKRANSPSAEAGAPAGADDPRMEAAMGAMEREFSGVDESDPKAMGRMMRRMADLTGEKISGEMEEIVRKLEEGSDPESLGEQLTEDGEDPRGEPAAGNENALPRFRPRRLAPIRDPKLYDYP